jgi:hypothetical protein
MAPGDRAWLTNTSSGRVLYLKKEALMETRTVSYFDLDDLDLTHCVVGPDLVARLDGSVTLYRREGRSVTPLGIFDGPASALAAIDALDAPGPITPMRAPSQLESDQPRPELCR